MHRIRPEPKCFDPDIRLIVEGDRAAQIGIVETTGGRDDNGRQEKDSVNWDAQEDVLASLQFAELAGGKAGQNCQQGTQQRLRADKVVKSSLKLFS